MDDNAGKSGRDMECSVQGQKQTRGQLVHGVPPVEMRDEFPALVASPCVLALAAVFSLCQSVL